MTKDPVASFLGALSFSLSDLVLWQKLAAMLRETNGGGAQTPSNNHASELGSGFSSPSQAFR